jgi:hypothetical protein
MQQPAATLLGRPRRQDAPSAARANGGRLPSLAHRGGPALNPSTLHLCAQFSNFGKEEELVEL